MSRKRTSLHLIVTSLALLTTSLTTASLALPFSPSERAQLFANCAGRLAALEEHQRMFDGQASEKTQVVMSQFEALIDAIRPDAIAYGMPGRQIWSWRINAKHAQSALLQRATFSPDARMVERAQTASDQYIAECEQLVIGT